MYPYVATNIFGLTVEFIAPRCGFVKSKNNPAFPEHEYRTDWHEHKFIKDLYKDTK